MYNDDVDDPRGHPFSARIPLVMGSSLLMEPGRHSFGSGIGI